MELSQLLQRHARAKTGALLQESPQQNEAQQHHRLIEETGPTHQGPDQGHDAGEIGTANPQSHQGVHAGSTGARSCDASAEDGATGPEQGHCCKSGMERQAADQGQGELARLADMTQHRQQQQHQGDHQLSPLQPPSQP